MRRACIGPLQTLILSFTLLMLAVSATAHAATVTTTWDNGPGSLRQALANAAPGETITFDLGCTVCTIELTSGALVVDTDVTISGPGPQQLFIDANGLSRVFRIAPGVTADIGGVYVTGGNSQMEDDFSGSGGGIWVEQGTLTLRNAIVSSNHADHGGGIDYDGTLTVINSEVSENTALSVGAGIHGSGPLTVIDTHVVRNSCRWGAGIYLEIGSLLHMTRGTLVGNVANRYAGAVFIARSASVTILESTIRGNIADDYGGGIVAAGALAIVNSTISNNESGDRGGAGVDSVGNLTIVNSTISGNSSAQAGTGGAVLTHGGSATIVNSTIVLNEEGGILADNSTVVLSNTIVAGNTGFDVSGSITTANNNLIGDVVGVDVASIIDLTLVDNGGSTQTHALLANSPAIGAGSNSSVSADEFDLDGDGITSEPIPFDQRGVGFPRLHGTNADIGAVEATCPAITVTPPALPNGTVGTAYSQSLSATGGKSPHTFSAASLPAGLTLSSGGLLSGTPTAAGTFTIAVTIVEDGGCASTIELTLTVVEDTTCGITVGPATLQTPYVAALYFQPLSTSPSGQFTYSVSSGALPPGLYVFSVGYNGFIGGFPTTPGTYTFTIKAKKKNSPCESTRTYTVTVPVTVAPQLTCVVKTGNKQYTARFGYDNTTGAAVTIPVGADNYFTPGTQNRGQVTVFQPGRVTNAFSVTFTVSGNTSNLAIWFVKGPDGVKRPVNITTATFPCQ